MCGWSKTSLQFSSEGFPLGCPPKWGPQATLPGRTGTQTWAFGAIAIRKRRSPWRVVRLGRGSGSWGQEHGRLTGPASGLAPAAWDGISHTEGARTVENLPPAAGRATKTGLPRPAPEDDRRRVGGLSLFTDLKKKTQKPQFSSQEVSPSREGAGSHEPVVSTSSLTTLFYLPWSAFLLVPGQGVGGRSP